MNARVFFAAVLEWIFGNLAQLEIHPQIQKESRRMTVAGMVLLGVVVWYSGVYIPEMN